MGSFTDGACGGSKTADHLGLVAAVKIGAGRKRVSWSAARLEVGGRELIEREAQIEVDEIGNAPRLQRRGRVPRPASPTERADNPLPLISAGKESPRSIQSRTG